MKFSDQPVAPKRLNDDEKHKFPHDYTEDEWVNLHRKSDSVMDPIHEQLLRDEHRERTLGLAGILMDTRQAILNLVSEDCTKVHTPEQFTNEVTAIMGTIALRIDGAMPNCKWVLSDYECMGLRTQPDGKTELEEHIRPTGNHFRHYWDLVNG